MRTGEWAVVAFRLLLPFLQQLHHTSYVRMLLTFFIQLELLTPLRAAVLLGNWSSGGPQAWRCVAWDLAQVCHALVRAGT